MAERVLVVKVANLETAVGYYEGDELVDSWSVTSRAPATPDEIERDLMSFLGSRNLVNPQGAILCSVVPILTVSWADALRTVTGARPLVVGPGLKNGLAVKYKDPGQVGADRVVCAVGMKRIHEGPAIVVDFDAATSLSVIDEDGSFLGGVIAAGLLTSLDALSESAAQIAYTEVRMPKKVIGRTTVDAVRSGVVFGEATRLDGLVDAIWDELGYETALVSTGRYADTVCAMCKHEFDYQPHLPLMGLKAIWDMNRT